MTDRAGRDVGVGGVVGPRRVLVVGFGVLFWGWLVVRWLHDWVLVPEVNTSDREPFVPPALFEAGATRLQTLAARGAPGAGALEWSAGGLEFLAFGARAMPALATGAWLTVVLTVVSILLGLVIAIPLAVARTYGGALLRWLALMYTEFVRGTPLLAQLFVLYYGLNASRVVVALPGVGRGQFVSNTAIPVAIIGFVINSSAYQAEYIRSALQSVDPGQLTAARSVGLSRLEGIRYVVLPQGLRYAIPGWTNELVYLVKYSSLAAFVTVPELFRAARNISSNTFRVLDIFLWAAILYLALVLSLSVAMSRFEAAVAVPGVGGPGERD